MRTWLIKHQVAALRVSFAAVFVLMVMAGMYVSHQISVLSSRTNQQGEVIIQLSRSLDTSRSQLADHGIKPKEPPSDQIVQGVQGLPGAQGIPGQTGPQGVPGTSVTGKPGVVGPSGPPGAPGVPGVPGKAGVNGTTVTGAPGLQGVPGTAGKDGTNGKDGINGVNGTDGKDGKDGTNGVNGKNGSPPAGWTWKDAGGQGYTCIPDDPFDVDHPHYACTADPAPEPTPTPTDTGSSSPPAVAKKTLNVTPAGDNGGRDGGGTPFLAGAFFAVVPERKYV
jgi:hypothetical protein